MKMQEESVQYQIYKVSDDTKQSTKHINLTGDI